MRYINLTQGLQAIVDDEDREYLCKSKWHVLREHDRCYAGRTEPNINGKHVAILMHREIMKTPKGMDVDHINGDGLDNRRINLRNCTRSQNLMNKKVGERNTSGYKGVCLDAVRKKWRSYIFVGGKQEFLGRHGTPIEAAQTYNAAAMKHFGEFARLNSIPMEVL
jgi:hypothetical protein